MCFVFESFCTTQNMHVLEFTHYNIFLTLARGVHMDPEWTLKRMLLK
jgi:hypothetical protein